MVVVVMVSGVGGSHQRKTGHEGHDEFLVVRVTPFTFRPYGPYVLKGLGKAAI